MIDDRAKPGDRLKIKADVWNNILKATEAFNAGQGGAGRSFGGSGGVELLWISANATGSGNYTAKQLLSFKGGWPKSCTAPSDLGEWTSSATCTFVNFPELFDADSHYLTAADGEAIGFGFSGSVGTDGKPVFFGVGFLVAECE